jgi:hypothetical protein
MTLNHGIGVTGKFQEYYRVMSRHQFYIFI